MNRYEICNKCIKRAIKYEFLKKHWGGGDLQDWLMKGGQREKIPKVMLKNYP